MSERLARRSHTVTITVVHQAPGDVLDPRPRGQSFPMNCSTEEFGGMTWDKHPPKGHLASVCMILVTQGCRTQNRLLSSQTWSPARAAGSVCRHRVPGGGAGGLEQLAPCVSPGPLHRGHTGPDGRGSGGREPGVMTLARWPARLCPLPFQPTCARPR